MKTLLKALFDKGMIPIILGFSVWLMIALKWWPFSVFSLNYVQILILSAPLFLVLLSFKSDDLSQKYIWWAMLFALFFANAFCFEQGLFAGLSALPWLIFCVFLTIKEIGTWLGKDQKTIKEFSRLAAFIYLLIGAFWLMADRLAIQPLGFDPTIVLLTVAHFHFAGFILLMITSWVLPFFPTKITKWVGLLVVSGVPLVAIGITTSHLHYPVLIETIAAIIMAIGGAAVGGLHIILGWRNRSLLFGWLWMIAGIALMLGMLLAMSYGLRNVVIIPLLTIPWMYAVHGTLNAVGFALPALLGWFLYFEKLKKGDRK